MADLGSIDGWTNSDAGSINDIGQVVGMAYTSQASTKSQGFLYSGGTITYLGSLPGYTNSYGRDINNMGQVVGNVTNAENSLERAILYENGTMTDLNTLIDPTLKWNLKIAYAINDSGQIVGYGSNGSQNHAFLLTPVPEPSTFILLGIGFISLMLYTRRKP